MGAKEKSECKNLMVNAWVTYVLQERGTFGCCVTSAMGLGNRVSWGLIVNCW